MILEQHYLACLAQASYLIVDEGTRTAAVVDPRRDVELYLERAAELGVELRYVLLTHFHADFVSGHLELAARTGAEILLGAAAAPEYAHRGLADGETLELGAVRLVALATPGHTPESTCYLVYDTDRDAEVPHAVLTGDTLFIGDVGRPDLMSSVGVTAEELGRQLYDSLHDKLLSLPDETLVYPGHGAGSMCGKNLSTDTVSTIGAQRRFNYALQPMTRDAFVRLVTAGQPEAPKYFGHDARINKLRRATLEESLERGLVPLPPERVLELGDGEARLLDVRSPADFAAGHLAGSTNIPLEGSFATWAGTLLDPGQAVVIVADPGREREAAVRLGRIGMDHVLGFLEGGYRAAADRPQRQATLVRRQPAELAASLARADAPLVLDVRGPGEWDAGHIEDALLVPLAQLEQRLDEVPADRDVVVQCKSGYRSSVAASLLARHGRTRIADLVGGIDAWRAAELPVVAPVG